MEFIQVLVKTYRNEPYPTFPPSRGRSGRLPTGITGGSLRGAPALVSENAPLPSSNEFYSPILVEAHEPPFLAASPGGVIRNQVFADIQRDPYHTSYATNGYVTSVMEERLVRWRPPNSQHNMEESFNGHHPFQVAQQEGSSNQQPLVSRGSATQSSLLSGMGGFLGRITGGVFSHGESQGVLHSESQGVLQIGEDSQTTFGGEPSAQVMEEEGVVVPQSPVAGGLSRHVHFQGCDDTCTRLQLGTHASYNHGELLETAPDALNGTERGYPVLNNEGYLSYEFLGGDDGGHAAGPGSKYPLPTELSQGDQRQWFCLCCFGT